jgi:hypothetical protein
MTKPLYHFVSKCKDLTYAMNVVIQLCQHHNEKLKAHREDKFYYRYEDDEQKTLYEEMMNDHLITIRANDDQEALIIDLVVRIIIDGHIGLFSFYTDTLQNDRFTIDQLYDRIASTKMMCKYPGYVSEKAKPLREHCLVKYEELFGFINIVLIKKPIIFDMIIINKIVKRKTIKWLIKKEDQRRINLILDYFR